MTVDDLIRLLRRCPSDADVCVLHISMVNDGDGYTDEMIEWEDPMLMLVKEE